jgi:hypothetical protein
MSRRLQRKAERDINYMFEQLESIDVDNIHADGVTLRLGNRILKLVHQEDIPTNIEDEVREEFRAKLAEKLEVIKRNINDKVYQMSEFVNTLRREYESKEAVLERKLRETYMMPEITHRHAQSGLSVVRGSRPNQFIWIYQGFYWPKFVDRRAIEPAYVKKMMSNILIVVKTKDSYVTDVTTRKLQDFEYFQHYHQSNPDCWGKWHWKETWRTPDDIIAIAQEAQVVLENINTGSIANRTPRGLPRQETLLRHLLPEGEGVSRLKDLRASVRRTGVRAEGTRVDEGAFWTTTDATQR